MKYSFNMMLGFKDNSARSRRERPQNRWEGRYEKTGRQHELWRAKLTDDEDQDLAGV